MRVKLMFWIENVYQYAEFFLPKANRNILSGSGKMHVNIIFFLNSDKMNLFCVEWVGKI